MPTFPEEESQSESSQSPQTKIGFVLGSGLPVVHAITSKGLIERGYTREPTAILPGTQTMQTLYKKGDNIVTYNGASWMFNGERVEHFEDLKD